MNKARDYGQDITWGAHEIDAFLRYNEMAKAQASAIFAWDRASMTDNQVGPRPVVRAACDLAADARAALCAA